MDYSAFNPTVWLVFTGSCVLIWAAVKVFQLKNPDYPDEGDKEKTNNNNHQRGTV